MAGCKDRLKTWCHGIPDWVWPHLTGKADDEPKRGPDVKIGDVALLQSAEHVLEQRLHQHESRLSAVEAKSMALLALTSVLSAVVTASLAVAFTIKAMDTPLTVLQWVIAIFVFYIAMNLLVALRATVSGLARREYKQLAVESVVPAEHEDDISYRCRIFAEVSYHVEYNEWVLNDKVSQMAVAHQSLRNVIVATGIVLAATAGIALEG